MENIASEGQHFTLTNSGTSVMKFQLYTSSSHFHVSLAISGTSKNYTSAGSVITIKPQETVQVLFVQGINPNNGYVMFIVTVLLLFLTIK